MATGTPSCLFTPLTPSIALSSPGVEPVTQFPITPPDSAQPFNEKPTKIDSSVVRKALHVISNEREALSHIENLYASSAKVQSYLSSAVSQIIQCQQNHGKIVFTGIGKSRLIALKLVATFNSLAIQSIFLHPTDALHGDLGIIRRNDVVVMITFSGKTPELLSLLPHLPSHVPLIAITSHTDPSTCTVLSPTHRNHNNSTPSILLPAPIHLSEKHTFGLSAPTTSTTVALALGDALALTVAERLHSRPGQGPAEIFAQYHPGGAIGASFNSATDLPQLAAQSPITEPTMQCLATRVDDVPLISDSRSQNAITVLDVMTAAIRAAGGWVRLDNHHIIAPRRIQRLIKTTPDFAKSIMAINSDESSTKLNEYEAGTDRLIIEKTDWISIPGSSTVQECRKWIISMREEGNGRGKQFLKRGTILGIVDAMNGVSGVVEIEDVVGDDFFNLGEQ